MKIILAQNKTILLCFVFLFILENDALAKSEHSKPIHISQESNPIIQNLSRCRLSNYDIEYDVKDGNRKAGHAKRVLSSIDGVTSLFSRIEASVVFLNFSQSEKSILHTYQLKGLVPTRYTKIKKKPFKKAETTSFTILQKNNIDDSASSTIFDPLTVYDHLREQVCLGLRDDVVIYVQDRKNTEKFQFTFKGPQSLQLPIGNVEALLMVRTRNTNTRKTFIWFDINKQFLPVKIEQTKDNDVQATLVASSVKVEQ